MRTKMKIITVLLCAMIILTAMLVPTFAAPNANSTSNGNGNQKVENTFDEVPKYDFNNAQFHCNDIMGENGRVWTQYGKQNGNNKDKLVLPVPGLSFTRNEKDKTVWNLVTEGIECEECGRTDWITFSNKDGVPDGKNIQMQHNGPSRVKVTIVKNWTGDYAELPNDKKAELKDLVRFSDGFALGTQIVKIGEYSISEYPIDWSYEFVSEDGRYDIKYTVDENNQVLPETGIIDRNLTLTFVNNITKTETPKFANITVKKDWVGDWEDENLPEEARNELRDLLGFTANFEYDFDVLGEEVEVIKPDEGKYIISEKTANFDGWEYEFEVEINGIMYDCTVTVIADSVPQEWTFEPDGEYVFSHVFTFVNEVKIDYKERPPVHVHGTTCENCKKGEGGNHKNCEQANPENTTNYYCVNCPEKHGGDLKVGAFKNGVWEIYVEGVETPLVCDCKDSYHDPK